MLWESCERVLSSWVRVPYSRWRGVIPWCSGWAVPGVHRPGHGAVGRVSPAAQHHCMCISALGGEQAARQPEETCNPSFQAKLRQKVLKMHGSSQWEKAWDVPGKQWWTKASNPHSVSLILNFELPFRILKLLVSLQSLTNPGPSPSTFTPPSKEVLLFWGLNQVVLTYGSVNKEHSTQNLLFFSWKVLCNLPLLLISCLLFIILALKIVYPTIWLGVYSVHTLI